MDDVVAEDPSVRALREFRYDVARLGLWSEASVAVAAIRREYQWLPYLFRLQFLAPGISALPSAKLFDATTADVLVRLCSLDGPDCWSLLGEMVQGRLDLLSELVEEELHLVDEKHPSLWGFHSALIARNGRAQLQLSRGSTTPFYEIFGFSLFDRLDPQLRDHHPPYRSLHEIASSMQLAVGGMDTNNAMARFEVSAEVPISMGACFYNPAQGGVELNLAVGRNVPLADLGVSLTPEPRCRLAGTDLAGTLEGESRLLKAVVPCERPSADVAVHVQFRDLSVASAVVRPELVPILWTAEQVQREEWEIVLARDFSWTRRGLRAALRKTLPARLAEVAEWRIRESILLRDHHAFFALVSAASVVEVLLHQRIAVVSTRLRARAWAGVRAAIPNLPKKLLLPKLHFDAAIALAQELGLLAGSDPQSIHLLRIARNGLHLRVAPSEEFSLVRASHAILTVLDLAKQLAAVKRARGRRRPATS